MRGRSLLLFSNGCLRGDAPPQYASPMANNSSITIVGNIARDPELRFTAGGKAVLEIGVAVNERKKVGDDWEDDVSFVDVTFWDQLAENVSESCEKGTRIIATGRIKQDSWEGPNGEKRSKLKITGDAIGIELRFATAEVKRNERSDQSHAGQQAQATTPAPAAGYDEADV